MVNKQLVAKLKDAWTRGKEYRIEAGTILIQLHKDAAHGEWGKILIELGIPASTAADYMVEASRQIHGIRVIGTPKDPEAEEIETVVGNALAKVEAAEAAEPPKPKKDPPIILGERNKVKGPVLYCSADQKEAYLAAKKKDKDRVYAIFHAALLSVIGELQEEVEIETLAA